MSNIPLPLVFVSGSTAKKTQDEIDEDEAYGTPYYFPLHVPERLTSIASACGEVLGRMGYGIVGCPPHYTRILAAQCALQGLKRVCAEAYFTSGSLAFPITRQDREKTIRLADAAIFICGSSGTREEFEICKELGLRPLIPFAGALGISWDIAKEMLNDPHIFFAFDVPESTRRVLANNGAKANECAAALEEILTIYKEHQGENRER